jgi:NTP pyrophosphatase (non-canonical NTP hydrolase)
MKVVVGGSMTFAKEQLEVKRALEEMGHEVLVSDDIHDCIGNSSIKNAGFESELRHCLETDIVMSFFNMIKEADAYVVVNKEKGGVRGYLGTAVLMELGLAYYLGKRIFLMEDYDKGQGYGLEVAIINPVVLNGDLSKIGGGRGDNLDGMSLTICASVDFSDRIRGVIGELEKRGCDVKIPFYTRRILSGEVDLDEYKRIKSERGDVEFRESSGVDLIKRHFEKIKNTDAILVLNYDKKGVVGYIGGNTFLEMGFAHVLGKKIYVLNELPKMGYNDELLSMRAIVLNGDLSKIDFFKSDSGISLSVVAEEARKMEDDLDLNIDDVLNKLTQEFGEFNDVVQKFRGRYCRKDVSIDEVKGELGDLIFNLSSVCNRLGIDSDEFGKFAGCTLEKFRGRKEDYRR